MAEHPLLARAKQRDRYTRTELAGLLGKSMTTLDRWIQRERIAYDLFEGPRKWFSKDCVVAFLTGDYLAAPAPKPVKS